MTTIIKRYFILNLKKVWSFKFNFFMQILSGIFDVLSIFLFWFSLKTSGFSIADWNSELIGLLIAFNIISAAVSKCFFGFRDIEFKIINGEIDVLLTKPKSTILLVLLEKLNVIVFLFKTIIGISFLAFLIQNNNYKISVVIYYLLICILATISLELLYGSVSMLSFKYGRIYSFREVLFSFRESLSYPISVFPDFLYNFFIRFIPLALISTIPAININLEKIDISLLFLVLTILLINVFILNISFKKGIKYYESTGA